MTAYAGIWCRLHGDVDIDLVEYKKQMSNPNALWKCPKCGATAQFNDERFEELHPQHED